MVYFSARFPINFRLVLVFSIGSAIGLFIVGCSYSCDWREVEELLEG